MQVISPVKKSKSFKVNEDKTLLECNGNSTILIVKERGVLIRRLGGFMSAHMKGERFIAYNNIINIQIYPSTTLKYGFIYFQTIRSSISTIKYLEAASNPDAVIFYHDKQSEFDGAISLISENNSASVNIIAPAQSPPLPQPDQKSSSTVNLEVNVNLGNSEGQVRCPKCGSTQINANKKGFNVGQALVGGLLSGGVGVVAGLWGSNEIRINCLKCGHRWKP